MRIRKLMNYVKDRLPDDDKLSKDKSVEEELELVCCDKKLDVKMTLGLLKQTIWDQFEENKGKDLVIYYRRISH